MVYNLPDIREASLDGKRVFLRADLDVPLRELKVQSEKLKVEIEDDTRLRAWMPTLQYLLDHGAKVIVAGKLGRPTGIDEKLSLFPVAKWLGEHLQALRKNCHAEFSSASRNASTNEILKQVQDDREKVQDDTTCITTDTNTFSGWKIRDDVFLLENLQFDPREKGNDPEFAKQLASLADIYVNDAFAMCHRSHASITSIPKILPHFAGFRLQEEIKTLSKVLDNPERPFVVVIGGAKIETKVPLVTKMCEFADYVLVGGKIAQERETLSKAAQECKEKKSEVIIADSNFESTDISQRSLLTFTEIIKNAKTVVWNGPVGKIESHVVAVSTGAEVTNENFRVRNAKQSSARPTTEPASANNKNFVSSPRNTGSEKGTRELAKAIAQSKAYTVVGGGDTLEFLQREGLINKFSFVSTGGGAMLAFLAGEKLPGIEVLLR